MGNLTINNGGIITNSINLPNLDLRYGPYESVQEAYGALGNIITPGLVVGIRVNGEIEEYQVNSEGVLVQRSVSISYNDLDDLPKINNTELTENKTAGDLGLATSVQGGKADTAIERTAQEDKIVSTSYP